MDAHLPPALCRLLRHHGHDATHTSELPASNDTTDRDINRISIAEQSIVISKDWDFYHSHLLHGQPFKLLLIRTGNVSTDDLLALLESSIGLIESAFLDSSLIEVSREGMTIVA